jgi:hypothetical protein
MIEVKTELKYTSSVLAIQVYMVVLSLTSVQVLYL